MTFYRIIEHIIKERILTFKDLSFSRTSRPEYQTAVAMVDGKQYHGGMCDRFKGMVSLYAYCKQRGIEFRILYNYPFDLSEYLVPSSYDWRLKEGEFSGCFRDCRIIYLRGESGHRLARLRTKKQIHFYGNMDILDVLNKDRGTSYRWGELFKELFRPSEALASQLADLHTGIGEEYDAAVFRFQNLLGDFPEYRFKPLESRQERERLKEKHPDAVISLPAQGNADLFTFFREKPVGNLKENPHSVSRLSLGVLSGSVFQVLHNPQRLLHRVPALSSFHVHHGADAAVVMFKLGPIKALLVRVLSHKPLLSPLYR